jgi:hypothetical protein
VYGGEILGQGGISDVHIFVVLINMGHELVHIRKLGSRVLEFEVISEGNEKVV